ncbi:MAG TPA: hypothetical protein VGG35_25170 [Streptosporangiaceae bacterium]
MSTGPADPGPVRTGPARSGPARTRVAGLDDRIRPDRGDRGNGEQRGAEQEAARQAMAVLMSLAVPLAESAADRMTAAPGQLGRPASGLTTTKAHLPDRALPARGVSARAVPAPAVPAPDGPAGGAAARAVPAQGAPAQPESAGGGEERPGALPALPALTVLSARRAGWAGRVPGTLPGPPAALAVLPGTPGALPAVIPPPRLPGRGDDQDRGQGHGRDRGRGRVTRRPPASAPPAWARLGTAARWPIVVILVAQSALSLRLMWRDSAAAPEAAYLSSWHLDPGHWLPGAAGLTAGRLLSLALMLTATTLLHGTTRRLYDRRSAFFAAALFAGLSGTVFLGVFASGDAVSAALLAAAAWLGAQAGVRRDGPQAGLAAAAGVAAALSVAAGYGAGPAGLAGLGLITLAVWRTCGSRAAARAAATAGGGLVTASCAVVLLTGPASGRPEAVTLHSWLAAGWLAGGAGGAGWPAALLTGSGRWLAVLAVLAVAGALVTISARQGWPAGALSVLLAAAALLIPAETIRAQAGAWMAVPACSGAWLGCIIAGYAVASLARAVPRAKAAAAFGVGLGVVALAAAPGAGWATQQVSWPSAGPVVSRVQAVLAGHPGPVLTDGTGDVLRLYLGRSLARRVLVEAGTGSPAPVPAGAGAAMTGGAARQCAPAGCLRAIAGHRFGVIVLSLWHAGPLRYRLQRAVVLAGYRRVALAAGDAGVPGGPASAARDAAAGSWNIWVRAGRS